MEERGSGGEEGLGGGGKTGEGERQGIVGGGKTGGGKTGEGGEREVAYLTLKSGTAIQDRKMLFKCINNYFHTITTFIEVDININLSHIKHTKHLLYTTLLTVTPIILNALSHTVNSFVELECAQYGIWLPRYTKSLMAS